MPTAAAIALNQQIAAFQATYKAQVDAINAQFRAVQTSTTNKATIAKANNQKALLLQDAKAWLNSQIVAAKEISMGLTLPAGVVPLSPVQTVLYQSLSPTPVNIPGGGTGVPPPVPYGMPDYGLPSSGYGPGYVQPANAGSMSLSRDYQPATQPASSFWPGWDFFDDSDKPTEDIEISRPPSSSTLVAQNDYNQPAPEVMQAMYAQQMSSYAYNPYDSVWSPFSGFGEFRALRRRPTGAPRGRFIRRINKIQQINAMAAVDGFSGWESLIGAVVSGVSSVASAAVSAELAPKPQKPIKQPPIVVNQAPSVASGSGLGISQNTGIVIAAGVALVIGIVVLGQSRGKSKRR